MLNNTTLVVGHRNPDMDAIAAAVGYAWVLNAQHHGSYTAARAGDLNAQTSFALKHFEMETPQLISDVRPRVRDVIEAVPALHGTPTLRDAARHYAAMRRCVVILDENHRPRGLLSPETLFGSLVDGVISEDASRLSAFLSQSAVQSLEEDSVILQDTDLLTQALQRLRHSRADDYLVVDAAGHYVGLCSPSQMLDLPYQKLVLVDHNEAGQAVPGIEEADVIEVLDHHRIDSITTVLPIRFRIEPVGSCSTLVAEQAKDLKLTLPKGVAGLLLCGLLSDTLVFKSVTTTLRDRAAASDLAQMAGLTGDRDEAIEQLGKALLMAGAGMGSRSATDIVGSDLKFYDTDLGSLAMSQVEITQFEELDARLPQLQSALNQLVAEKSLILALLMVTDILRGNSRLVAAGQASVISNLPYPLLRDGTLQADGVVSRKKQLVPTVLAAVRKA